jgi:death on curing protein
VWLNLATEAYSELPPRTVALMYYSRDVTKAVTLRQAGGSVNATLPKDMADRLHLEAGDRVLAVETDRDILLTPSDPEVERALSVATTAAKNIKRPARIGEVAMPRRREPRWLHRLVVDAVHADQLRQHGGLPGVRDENVLESALARPRQKWNYDKSSDVAALAAAYAFGFVQKHPYKDGNRRIGFLALVTFLGINDYELESTDEEVVTTMLALADGSLTEARLTSWVRDHLRRPE